MSANGKYRLEDRYLADEGTVFLTGIQALARLPLEQLRADRRAGLTTAALITGYPGSPLGGYDGAAARAAALAPDLPVRCRPAMNEEYAASAVMGSQLAAIQPDCRYDGIVGLWYGKAPGVDRASDALRHAVYAGTSMYGGAVAIVGDDPSAKSSTLPSSSAGILAGMHVPLLYPGDPAEALDLGRHAIALSRLTGLWSALKIVADVADATASVELHPERIVPVLPTWNGRPYLHRPDGRLLTPHTLDLEREITEVRYELAKQYASDNHLNRVTVDPKEAWLGIVASGITYREVREAFGRLGLESHADIEACGIRLLKMGMPLPFNPETVRRFSRDLHEVFVIEEKQPNLESLVKDALYALPGRPAVVGKTDEDGAALLPGHGALDADVLAPILWTRLESRVGHRLDRPEFAPSPELPVLQAQRTPFFCSGCPHNRSTVVPDGALVGAGIGCHTMTLLMDEKRVGEIAGVACMGNEGTQWIGMSDFVEREHFIQNLGDGTFFHSGQLAIQAAVAARVNVTYKLLFNGTVAMTGGQDPQGQLDVPAVTRILLEQGVAKVWITADEPDRYDAVVLPPDVEVFPRARLLEVQERLARVPGVTVLIHDQACAAETRRARKRGRLPTPKQRVVINPRVCEGCGDCGRVSNCLSVQPVETFFGRKTEIEQTSCNLDYSCLEGDCPSFMTVTSRPERFWHRWFRADPSEVASAPPAPPAPLPDPELRVPADDFAARITGIGGTGVVTVSQVLGTAAMLDGFQVRGLDQIGLSQKAGPVVSDLRLSRGAPTHTNRLGEGQADLLLAFDGLVAASEKGLLTASPEKTTVVGSTSPTPTGEMITHPEPGLPTADALAERLSEVTRADAHFWADAAGIARALFGGATTANLFVVGMAVQAGCLPISPARIEEAIDLNGVSVDQNLAAFRWGRAQVANPAAIEEACAATASASPIAPVLPAAVEARVAALGLTETRSLALRRYAAELIAWQNVRTAERWLDVVEQVAEAEARLPGTRDELTLAVAANLYKLTAYKDEYEVARLMRDPEGLAPADRVRGRGARLHWHLHPPLLRAFGLQRKLRFGSWARAFMALLAAAKPLRGSWLDPFRWAEVRRLERELPPEYVERIEAALPLLRPGNHAELVAFASLPEQIRGFEDLKIERIDAYRRRAADAWNELRGDPPESDEA
ncbi:MAG: indolepyruvate ferredoxin oxidoreductase family protein [Myxococcota bacterium]